MSQTKLIIIWTINCSFFLLNFYLWAYSPGGDGRSDGKDRVAGLLDSFVEEEELLARHARSHRLSPSKDDDSDSQPHQVLPQKYDAEINRAIVESWKKERGEKFILGNISQTDAYVEIKKDNFTTSKVHFSASYQVPRITYTSLVNCEAILRGDARELERAEAVMLKIPKEPIYEETYMEWTETCDTFKQQRGYVEVPLSQEEESYPLAFSIAMYTDVEQTERLLRAIYQPQNIYCIHIDTKSSLLLHRTVQSLVRCFPNVFIANHLDKIKWGDVSVLLPAINCMRDLVRHHRGKWKYYINLTGQEMPLRTNWELVQIAKIFNGSNDIGGSTSRMEMERVQYRWTHRWSKTYQQTIFFNTFKPKDPFHVNLTFVKGELHGLFSRRMVEYIVEDKVSQAYLQWCWDSGHPSEHYWNVLNYNKHLGAPGGYQGPLDIADAYSTHLAIRAKSWVGHYDNRECHGKVVRGICVYGVKDVPWLATRKELFANKFHMTFQYLGYDCLEERHRNRTMMGDRVPFDREFYVNLPTVKYSRKDGL